MEVIFKHYGAIKLDRRRKYATNKGDRKHLARLNKPAGFWASPVGKKFSSWEDFCRAERYNMSSLRRNITFRLKRYTNILYITNEMQLNAAFKRFGYVHPETGLKHLKWMEIEESFDGVYFSWKNYDLLKSRHNFSSWDCDSLVIFNLDVIEEL